MPRSLALTLLAHRTLRLQPLLPALAHIPRHNNSPSPNPPPHPHRRKESRTRQSRHLGPILGCAHRKVPPARAPLRAGRARRPLVLSALRRAKRHRQARLLGLHLPGHRRRRSRTRRHQRRPPHRRRRQQGRPRNPPPQPSGRPAPTQVRRRPALQLPLRLRRRPHAPRARPQPHHPAAPAQPRLRPQHHAEPDHHATQTISHAHQLLGHPPARYARLPRLREADEQRPRRLPPPTAHPQLRAPNSGPLSRNTHLCRNFILTPARLLVA